MNSILTNILLFSIPVKLNRVSLNFYIKNHIIRIKISDNYQFHFCNQIKLCVRVYRNQHKSLII